MPTIELVPNKLRAPINEAHALAVRAMQSVPLGDAHERELDDARQKLESACDILQSLLDRAAPCH